MDFGAFGITPDQVDQFRKFLADQAKKVAADQEEQVQKMETGGNANTNGDSGSSDPVVKHNAVHVGVFCENCKLEICGSRYQCMECIDYNLCSKCEGNGHHAAHVMMRISFPEQTPPKLATDDEEMDHQEDQHEMGRRESREYNKWMKRAAMHQQRSEKAYARAAASGSGKGGRSSSSRAEGPSVDFATVATGIGKFLNSWGVPVDPKELYDQFQNGTGPFAKDANAAPESKTSDAKPNGEGATLGQQAQKTATDLLRTLQTAALANLLPKNAPQIPSNGSTATNETNTPATGEWNETFTQTLNQLVRMGFSNDRGHLTKLIAEKKGDLAGVLGALFPN